MKRKLKWNLGTPNGRQENVFQEWSLGRQIRTSPGWSDSIFRQSSWDVRGTKTLAFKQKLMWVLKIFKSEKCVTRNEFGNDSEFKQVFFLILVNIMTIFFCFYKKISIKWWKYLLKALQIHQFTKIRICKN